MRYTFNMNKQVAVAAGTVAAIIVVAALYARSTLVPWPPVAQNQSSGQARTALSPAEANISGTDQLITDPASSLPPQIKSPTEVSTPAAPTEIPSQATPTTTEPDRTTASLKDQLRCAQLEVAVINHFLNDYDNAPTAFSSQSHFDTKLDKCFVELRYDQFCAGDNCHVLAIYDATNKRLLECYNPVSSADFPPTGCDDPQHNRSEISTTTYSKLLEQYMTE
jgi:hypothetical protein